MFGWLMCLGSWLLKRGLAKDDYRRLGVKRAVVHDIRTMRLVRNFLETIFLQTSL